MATYSIETTDLEDKLLRLVMTDVQEWADNFLSVRANDSLSNVKKIAINKYLEEEIQMPTNNEALVNDMLSRGWISYATNSTPEE